LAAGSRPRRNQWSLAELGILPPWSKSIASYSAGKTTAANPALQPTGFREINWDSLPDEEAAPNAYAPDFFNAPTAPRARGIVLATPGEGLFVSADSDNPYGAPAPLWQH